MMMLMMMMLMMPMMALFFPYNVHQDERSDTPPEYHLEVSRKTPYTVRPFGLKTPYALRHRGRSSEQPHDAPPPRIITHACASPREPHIRKPQGASGYEAPGTSNAGVSDKTRRVSLSMKTDKALLLPSARSLSTCCTSCAKSSAQLCPWASAIS